MADSRFAEAVEFAGKALEKILASAISKVKAQKIVHQAVAESGDSPIVVLPQFVPWQEYLLSSDITGQKLFVVFESFGTYMVQTVPISPESFKDRKSLPEAWAGLRGEAFVVAIGVADGGFCHPGRFICGSKSLEGAMHLAELAVAAE